MHVFLLAALTMDGFIGRDAENRSFDWTSDEDKKFYVEMIKRAGVVVMGLRTFQTFTRYPKGLHFVLYTHHPEEFVNPKPAVITTQTTQAAPAELISELAQAGHQKVAICGGASVYTQFLQAGVVDTLFLSIEPRLFGSGVKFLTTVVDLQFQFVGARSLGTQTVVLEYQRKDDKLKNA